MPNTVMLKARGLWTFPNYLSNVPEGALLDATNCIIDRDGIIESRRGVTQYGDFGVTNDRSKQLLVYKDRILVHYNSVIAYDDGTGNLTAYGSTFSEVQSGLRIKYIELNGNLYVTTGSGIKKISSNSSNLSTATISDAGIAKALDVKAVVNYDNPGFFLGYSKIAYRVLWGITDANDNLLLGSPSSRTVVINYSPNSGTVDLTFDIPEEITSTNYFYQVYRTVVTTSGTFAGIDDLEPGDEMKLVFEDNVTSAQLTAGTIEVNDVTPEDFQAGGTPLYTNPVSGDGILQSNEKPPLSKDIAIYKNSAFYGNTQSVHRLALTLLGTGGFKSYGAFGDAVSITSITATNPAVVTFSGAGHGLGTSGTKYIAIVGSGAVAVDDTHLATITGANTLTIPVDGTGATAATTSVFTSYITITKGVSVNRYFFVGRPERVEITTTSFATLVDGSYFLIDSAENENKYFIWYDKTGTTPEPSAVDTVGRIPVRVDISVGVTTAAEVAEATDLAIFNNTRDFISSFLSSVVTIVNANSGTGGSTYGLTAPGGSFSISIAQEGFGENTAKNYVRLSRFSSAAQAVDDTARSLINVVNSNSSEEVYMYYLSGPDDIPGLMNVESRTFDSTAFSFIANEADVGALFNANITTSTSSSNETNPNRIYFSKTQQPEAVPLVNFFDVGPKDNAILRIIGLRDSLFILKEDGVYRLTGESTSNFSVTLFDNSCHLNAPDSAVVLNNQIYVCSDDGVSTISETGVGIVSRPIENQLNRLRTDIFTNFSTATFGVSYENDKAYFLWTVTDTTDTFATQCFRYNTLTQTWTRWDNPQNCGLVNPRTNLLYLGATDINFVERERKLLTRKDYADRQFNLQIPSNPIISDTELLISATTNVDPGDVLLQTQYVTVSQYNNLLRKLDLDPRVGAPVFDSDYFTTLEMVAGDSLTNKMTDLVAKLNADPGTSGGYVFSGATDFATIQTEYNTMITAMNADPILKFNNYQSSTGTTEEELFVTDSDINTNVVTTDFIPPFMVGPIVHYKGIVSTVIWAPITMGDPSILKHVREATTLFENTAFKSATMGYNTDLSPSFESIDFVMNGSGVWNNFVWGETTWGGGGTTIPFRTYIPRQKQRCRFIRGRFEHINAFDKFAIFGVSYVYEVNSERAYR